MLYLVSTPIGNRLDITLRAIETLKNCDYILCEDTRHSLNLLQFHGIKKPLKSYHKFNENSQVTTILEDLKNGLQVCLISDAGTPGISDPGEILVKHCVDNHIPFTAIPGPCAAIQALICSGLPTARFQFYGFLPRKENELKRELQNLLSYTGTSICYESALRLMNVLKLIQTMQPQRQIVVARELTKKFEEIVRGTSIELIDYWNTHPLKGEIVLLIAPCSEKTHSEWQSLSPQEHVNWMQKHYSISTKEATKLVAELRGVPKRQIYQELIKDNDRED